MGPLTGQTVLVEALARQLLQVLQHHPVAEGKALQRAANHRSAAFGGRLARGFTAPLMEIVRGTQRIATGAASLAGGTSLVPSVPRVRQ